MTAGEHPPFDPRAEGWTDASHSNPFIAKLGSTWIRHEGDVTRFGMFIDASHMNTRGRAHGGAILALADHALGQTTLRAQGGHPQATVQLDLHFIDAAWPGDFVEAVCRVNRQTGSMLYAQAELHVAGRLIATVMAVYKRLRSGEQGASQRAS